MRKRLRILIRYALAASLLAWLATAPLVVVAQAPAARQRPGTAAKILPPRNEVVQTGDKLQLAMTYYPGGTGRDTVPVILLHDYRGSRHDLEPLAVQLQAQGWAVAVPDLRGHGESTNIATARGTQRIEVDSLPLVQFQRMITEDVEAVKRFLVQRNNAGELNIDKLTIVGAGMGSVIAINFAARDWSWPDLATGKQGRDVKALVLLSPVWSFRGLRINDALAHPALRQHISLYIAMGAQDSGSMQEARRLYQTLERQRPKPTGTEDKTLFYDQTLATTLQGTKLLGATGGVLEGRIVQFIKLRVADQAIAWAERKDPLAIQ